MCCLSTEHFVPQVVTLNVLPKLTVSCSSIHSIQVFYY